MIIIPAYGRDYKNAKAAKEAFLAGHDFRIADISCRWNGSYVSLRDLEEGTRVEIRYKKLTQAIFCVVPKRGE